MTAFRFIIRSFLHYLRPNIAVSAGVIVSTAVLTGALIIGDSVRYSLEKTAHYRLGKATYALTASDRYFSSGLANTLQDDLNITCIPVLQTDGMAITEGGAKRINNIRITGVDERFNNIVDEEFDYGRLSENKVFVSKNLADVMNLEKDDLFLLRLRKTSLIPLNTPLVSDEESAISIRVTVGDVVGENELGSFNLRNSQTAPFNVFISMDFLNQLMKIKERSNAILIASPGDIKNQDDIIASVQKVWDLEDASLKVRHIPETGELELYSERVFIEPAVYNVFNKESAGKRFILTYFVNAIRKDNRETPYSFVSTLDEQELKESDIIINEWLAKDLGIQLGDTITMAYFTVGPLRKLVEESTRFRVKEIVPMKGRYSDASLMPFIPGLSDAGSCSDWEAGIPIDLSKIRDKDEVYWNQWRGTPKAFIRVDTAVSLWQNRFGSYTAIRFKADEMDEKNITEIFRNNLDPVSLGFTIRNVKEEGLNAARSGVDFGQLFIGLSFFVLVSAVLLTGLLFLLNLSVRSTQAGTLSALGFSDRLIKGIFLLEGSFIALTGALFGLILAVLYTKIIFLLLNKLWFDIVRTSVLEIKVNPLTLITGFLLSIMIAFLTILISLRGSLKRQVVDIQKGIMKQGKLWTETLKIILTLITGLACVVIIFVQFITGESSTFLFFTAGGLLLISLLLIIDRLLRHLQHGMFSFSNVNHLSFRNMIRNRRRSFAIVILFALGTFIVVATGSNRKDMTSGANNRSSGTGGYDFFTESTVPVLHDLNEQNVAREYGLEGEYSFIQFRKGEGDDASCLNLNRISKPAILGVDPGNLEGRFSFVTNTRELDENNPWSSLDKSLEGGVIPAIADQTAIQWGLGRKVGDTLFYTNSTGDTLMLKLIGGLAPSIFQGNVIISNQQFLENFPSSSGSSVFLIETTTESDTLAEEDLFRAFRDYGWQMTRTTDRLAEFYSVENTYLSIFLMLGILSLIIGTIGLGILLARSIMERKSEIGLLQALGYKQKVIYRIVFTEYFILLLTGIIIGFVPAIISTLPSLLSLGTDVSISNLIYILLFLILNSIIWIGLFTRINIGKNLVRELRTE